MQVCSFQLRRTNYGGNRHRVKKSIGVLEFESTAINQRLTIIQEAVIVTEALQDLMVHEMGRAKPAAAEVNIRYVAPSCTGVYDFNSVCWDAIRRKGSGSLSDDNICRRTLLPPRSVWLLRRCLGCLIN